MNQTTRPLSLIVAQSLLQELELELPDIRERINRHAISGDVRLFPDGSVYVEGNERTDAVYREILDTREKGGHIYYALASLRPMCYHLFYSKSYYESLFDPFIVDNMREPLASEHNLEHLAITVSFRRKPNAVRKEQFAQMVRDWYASVNEYGMFEDGPISNLSPHIDFGGLHARFWVDAHRSGQDTLNWFVLKALDFGIGIFPICLVVFARDEEVDKWFSDLKGKTTRLPIRPPATIEASRTVALDLSEEDTLPTHLPPDCTPYAELSTNLRLFRRPILEWDALQITVYFTVAPTDDQQNEFRRLIEAWRTIANYGGLGGTGIFSATEVTFDEEAESATLHSCYLGDCVNALPVLLRVFEEFDKRLPIEAVVLGSSGGRAT